MLWMFTTVGLAALAFAAALRRRESRPGGHGLESIRAMGS
jgi:hypothetical protein